VAPLVTLACLAWAGWLALASEGGSEEVPSNAEPAGGTVPLARRFHLAHLTVLFFAAGAGSAAVRWWQSTGVELLLRLGLVLALGWVVGDLLPRVLAQLSPRIASLARQSATRSLMLFTPLYWTAAWADQRAHEASRDEAALPNEDQSGPGLFTLPDSNVSDVMTPRIDIVAVDRSHTFPEVLDTVRQSAYARLLVFDGTPDDVIGVIYAKDLLGVPSADSETDWESLMRPVAFVPEGKRLDQQLRDFQRGRQHIAVVVDEHGGTAGLVTLEDILEEIVGEIQDERDEDEVVEIQEVEPGTWLVEGGTPLVDLEAVLAEDLGREDVSTVGGLVMAEFGRVPSARESLQLGRVRLTVNRMEGRRVQRVLVHRLPESPDADGGDVA
jgi:CBS domain containing-hemolysin-like protein